MVACRVEQLGDETRDWVLSVRGDVCVSSSDRLFRENASCLESIPLLLGSYSGCGRLRGRLQSVVSRLYDEDESCFGGLELGRTYHDHDDESEIAVSSNDYRRATRMRTGSSCSTHRGLDPAERHMLRIDTLSPYETCTGLNRHHLIGGGVEKMWQLRASEGYVYPGMCVFLADAEGITSRATSVSWSVHVALRSHVRESRISLLCAIVLYVAKYDLLSIDGFTRDVHTALTESVQPKMLGHLTLQLEQDDARIYMLCAHGVEATIDVANGLHYITLKRALAELYYWLMLGAGRECQCRFRMENRDIFRLCQELSDGRLEISGENSHLSTAFS
nr:hypothetical protein Iba_chr03cCG2500 [Ipomoea batatas]